MASSVDYINRFKFRKSSTDYSIWDYFYHYNHYVASQHMKYLGWYMYSKTSIDSSYMTSLSGMDYEHLQNNDGWVKGEKIPYYYKWGDGAARKSIQLNWIEAGTKPTFQLLTTIYSGSGSISRSDSYLTIGNTNYWASRFENGVVPKRLIVVVQGGGGGGAGTRHRASGGGGGSGACTFAVIDVTNSWRYEIGGGGSGGQYYTDWGANGQQGGTTYIGGGGGAIWAGGGGGATAASNGWDTSAGGEGATSSGNDGGGIWFLDFFNGARGGNGSFNPAIGSNYSEPRGGGDMSGTVYATKNSDDQDTSLNKYAFSYSGGTYNKGTSGDPGSGAASCCGNGGRAAPGNGTTAGGSGSYGAGGGGGMYATGWYNWGGSGGNGLIKIYY